MKKKLLPHQARNQSLLRAVMTYAAGFDGLAAEELKEAMTMTHAIQHGECDHEGEDPGPGKRWLDGTKEGFTCKMCGNDVYIPG